MHFFAAVLALQFDAGAKAPQAKTPINAESYLTPPAEIAEYFNQPRHLNVNLSNLNSARTWFARVQANRSTNLADISNKYDNLAGIMIDPIANRARTMSYRTATSIVLTSASDFSTRVIEAPKGKWLSGSTWSPNGRYLLYMVHGEESSTVWVHDAEKNSSQQVSKQPILATRVTPEWVPDSSAIVGVFVPNSRGEEPKMSAVPTQPKVQVSDAGKNRLRVFRTLLQNEVDQKRFEYFMSGQLAKVGLDGKTTAIGKPAMISGFEASPKGTHFRVTTIQKPFSYIVPASNFGSKEEIWDADGKALTMLSETALRPGEPAPDPTATAPTPPAPAARRQIGWLPDGSGLYFVRTKVKPQAMPAQPILAPGEDEQGRGQRPGTAPTAAREPEELVKWAAPFRKEDETVLATREQGFGGLIWNPTGTAIFLSETKDGETKFKKIELNKEATESVLWSYKSSEQNPGSPVLAANSNGVSTLDDTAPKILLRGTTTTPDEEKNPSRNFLNVFDTKTKKIDAAWKGEEKAYETIDGILNSEGSRLLIDHQTSTQPSNSFLFEGGKRTKQVTQNEDYAPDLTEAKRYRFQVTRADGFKFWVKVTAPKWHVEGDKLPAFFWFYPSEVDNQAAYDRTIRNTNPNLFPVQGGSPKSLLIRRGWALVEPDCPIVGPRTRVNDFYVNDLRNNLSATIDALEVKGIADRTKLAIGGHSYGGFSTANAMVHTPFFKAGIAGAGNYNRTLTPLAFQSEQRTLFEARSTYLDMSPILYAENLSGALLMYAGMDDQNVGTDPINTVRMFSVMESIGKPAALYMYPYEDHGQVARETLMDQWARWIAWLDKYVLGKDK